MNDAGSGHRLRGPLRQMIAVLEIERQALAGFDLDAVLAAAADKHMLCEAIDRDGATVLDEECVALLESARRLRGPAPGRTRPESVSSVFAGSNTDWRDRRGG